MTKHDARLPESLPLQTRQGAITPVTRAEGDNTGGERRYRVKFSTGAEVKRWGYTPEVGYGRYREELVIDSASVDMSRINAGAAVLDSHDSYGLGSLLARTESGSIEGGEAYCDIVFPPAGIDEDIDRAEALVNAGTIRFVSAGYTQDQVEIVMGERGEMPLHRVTRWTPLEISLVSIPADAGAQIQRSEQAAAGAGARLFPVTFTRTETPATRRSPDKEGLMADQNHEAGGDAGNATIEREAPVTETRAAAPALTATQVLQLRSQAVSLGIPDADADAIVGRAGATPDAIREAILATGRRALRCPAASG